MGEHQRTNPRDLMVFPRTFYTVSSMTCNINYTRPFWTCGGQASLFVFLSQRPVPTVPGAAGAKFSDKYRFSQYRGEHRGFSSCLGPHGFPWVLVSSC